ncbi:FAD-binding and (Fe-S)-binding domain-containing protein [Agarilytica rhodophyticola]|uniref:FAD-binding and (Fe-S)-binding domain-containing protein n=1 Tax=Agarilytica rhodophyticola TaxID=1737490 RepID=UPI000B344CBA|nr:FAD-binding and (Fe-S)-binding domain-containing protein [Agarilytica rhodophyticola]
MAANWSDFLDALRKDLSSEHIIEDLTRRRAMGVDASFYSLVPKLVLQLDDIYQVQYAVKMCYRFSIPLTFRAAGTSLSGQAISDSVLLTLSNKWRGHEILDNGDRIRLQPGVIGADANRYLAPFNRKIGPDPASINACKIGGIVANNASGMCCGVANNSYHTLHSMEVMLADGTILKSDDENSIRAFRESHKKILDGLEELARTIKNDSHLEELIRHKYRIKNTTGYALNSLIDFNDPMDILIHLMVGSEGTLGFISEITYNTVVEHQHKASGLYLFATAEQACKIVGALSGLNVDAVELMDQRALDSVKGKPGLPDSFCDNNDSCTALLIETRAVNEGELFNQMDEIVSLLDANQPLQKIAMTSDPQVSAELWAIRKATFPAVGAVRPVGSTVIIEDIAFPLDKLADGLNRLHQLFDEYSYHDAIIFGHALAGNLHFVFTQSFDEEQEVQRYHAFMQAVAHLVAVEFEGSLKAEHGTGRNMAPFVELEWGSKAYDLMWRVKELLDPKKILNPGVILNNNQEAHIQDLKSLPKANSIVDACTECGFCEPVCPSKNLSFTPRQRIAIWRRINDLRSKKDDSNALELRELNELEKQYDYLGIDTCAATGLCAERCPIGINTGDLVRELRAERRGKMGEIIASSSAEHFSGLTKAVAGGLTLSSSLSKVIGSKATDIAGKALHYGSGKAMPLWYSEWPTRAKKYATNGNAQDNLEKLIYFPSCASRNMGPAANSAEDRSQLEVTSAVFAKAGYQLILPENIAGLCCGMPYNSKGFAQNAEKKGKELLNALDVVSEQGKIAIIFDTSPCKLQLQEWSHQLPIYEINEFVAQFVLARLDIQPIDEPIALHITCSSQKMQLAPYLRQIAHSCSTQVIEPEDTACCGFAGDKGMFVPELNASALQNLKQQLPNNCTKGYSNSRTCEIGLSHHSGIEYQSLMYLLDRVASAAI